MEKEKSLLVEKLHGAMNILVTVSSNPSVDDLAACIGMTVWLNKLGKHATAVFSGDIPNALEFLQPEATIEKDTNSLRDFIIALDKSKADKLRYKVEDRVVKIFITPYRTSLSSNDLEFSQGDFNVDAIVAIGVTVQQDLDNAIIAHGRILHDATVMTINSSKPGELGSINWQDATASSLCELIYEVGSQMDANQLDPQIATALLTGIVSETERFSNVKTTPHTMSVAAALMSAGANQQLVSTKLEAANKAPEPVAETVVSEESKETEEPAKEEPAAATASDGSLSISHNGAASEDEESDSNEVEEPAVEEAAVVEEPTESKIGQAYASNIEPEVKSEPQAAAEEPESNKIITQPPTMGGRLNSTVMASNDPEPSSDPLSLPPVENQLLNREPLNAPISPSPVASIPPLPEQTAQPLVEQPVATEPETKPAEVESSETLSVLEQQVHSSHLDKEEIMDQVQEALKSSPIENESRNDLNAAHFTDSGELDLQPTAVPEPAQVAPAPSLSFNPAQFEVKEVEPTTPSVDAAPSVPPPIVPPNFLPPTPPTP